MLKANKLAPRMHSPFWRPLSAVLAGLLVSACGGTLNRAPDPTVLRAVRSIDVVIDVPANNFAYDQANTPLLGIDPINLVAAALSAGISHAVTATAREAQGPVGLSVEDIDLRQTVMAELAQMRESSATGPTLTLSEKRLSASTITSAKEFDAALATLAKSATADATLYLRVYPWFRTRTRGLPAAYTSALLLDRSGKQLLSVITEFIGPNPPDGDRADVIQWWADQRYRRFLLHAARAGTLPIADALWKAPQSSAQIAALEEKLRLMPRQTQDAQRLRTDPCVLDANNRKVVYRFERQRETVLAVALCEGGDGSTLPADSNPNISWISEAQPGLSAPQLKPSAPSASKAGG